MSQRGSSAVVGSLGRWFHHSRVAHKSNHQIPSDTNSWTQMGGHSCRRSERERKLRKGERRVTYSRQRCACWGAKVFTLLDLYQYHGQQIRSSFRAILEVASTLSLAVVGGEAVETYILLFGSYTRLPKSGINENNSFILCDHFDIPIPPTPAPMFGKVLVKNIDFLCSDTISDV